MNNRSFFSRAARHAGFTLIETLVAISVLLVSLAGPLTIATKSLSTSLFARDQVTAFYLAEEGVEQIRNMRDNNILAGNSWLTGISAASTDPCYFGNACAVDAKNNTISRCSGTCAPLKYDSSTGFYTNTSGVSSIFTRTVTLTSVTENEVAVAVKISWQTGLFQRSFQVRENILNWSGTALPAPTSCSGGQVLDPDNPTICRDVWTVWNGYQIGGVCGANINGLLRSNSTANTASIQSCYSNFTTHGQCIAGYNCPSDSYPSQMKGSPYTSTWSTSNPGTRCISLTDASNGVKQSTACLNQFP